MTGRESGPIRRANDVARCTVRLPVVVLLLLAGGMPAFAAGISGDAAAAEDLVFVGELVSIEKLPDPCLQRELASDGRICISMDALYRATYRVLQPVVGQPAADVTFSIADHYGYPRFAHFPHALLFVHRYEDGLWLYKYQGYPLHRTVDGKWAACGEVDHRGVGKARYRRAKPLVFSQPIASKQTFDEDGWEWMLPTWAEERRNYQLKQEEVRCLRGSLLPEAYEIVRQGALSDVPLPPWPATP